MLLNIIIFLKNKYWALMTLFGSAAIILYFLILYFVSMLSDNTIMLSIAYRNKALSERIALLSTNYLTSSSDAKNHQCISEVLQTDLSLLKSSNTAIACSKKAGKIVNDKEDKMKFLSELESIDNVNNYIIHGNNLLKANVITAYNEDFLYLLNNISNELLSDLKKIIDLQEQELTNSAILIKNTEKLFSIVIWLIIITKIIGHQAITNIFAPKKQIKKILIVEDNRVSAETISKIIENGGHLPVVASNGQEALDIIKKDRDFVLIFMDCEMPIMDGFESTSNIRKQEKDETLPRIPIIALTANVMEGYSQECLANGMDDYLPKPVTVGSINNMIQKWERRYNYNRSQIDEL